MVASQLVLCSLYLDVHWALQSLDSARVCWFAKPLASWIAQALDHPSHCCLEFMSLFGVVRFMFDYSFE